LRSFLRSLRTFQAYTVRFKLYVRSFRMSHVRPNVLRPLLTSVCSAEPCNHLAWYSGYPRRGRTRQISPGKHTLFHPMYPPHLPQEPLGDSTFVLLGKLSQLPQPRLRFVVLESGVCLRLPSDSTSRSTPLPSANNYNHLRCTGLSPARLCTCRAHQEEPCRSRGMATQCESSIQSH
jgi:hypothetical protein